MQRWQDEFAKNPIFTTLSLFKDAASFDVRIEDSTLELERVRFTKFVRMLDDALSAIDPDLAPIDLLNQINGALGSHGAVTTVTRLIATGDPNLYRELNSQVNPSISYILQIYRNSPLKAKQSRDAGLALDSLERFFKIVEERQKTTERFSQEVEVRLSDAISSIQTVADSHKATIQQLETKISEVSNQYNELVSQTKAQVTNQLAMNRAEHIGTLSSLVENFKGESKKILEDQSAKIDESRKSFEDDASAVLKSARTTYEKILKLYELTAVVSVTGGHKTVADREYNSARNWRYVTIGAVSAAAVWILLSIFAFHPDLYPSKLFWLGIAKSASLTGILVSLAVYASKQSTLHRKNEARARAFFLQVQAFDPFIANLPKEKQEELKEALSARIFGVQENDEGKEGSSSTDFEGLERLIGISEKMKALFAK